MLNITVAGVPVLVDVDKTVESWIDSYIECAVDDPFFSHKHSLNESLSGWDLSNNFYFESVLPSLPPIRLGRIQWPCVGVDRFARGLFVVDTAALAQIAATAWGATVVTEPEEPEGDPVVNPPESWIKAFSVPVDVVIVPDPEPSNNFIAKMFVLPPIKISDDVWMLRIVDGRFFRRAQLGPVGEMPSDQPLLTWDGLFSNFASVGYDISYVAESGSSFGKPDCIFANSNAPLSLMVDSACYSVGCRPVVPVRNSSSPDVAVVCEQASSATTKRSALLGMSKVTGGDSTIGEKPSALSFRCPVPRSYFSGEQHEFPVDVTLTGSGVPLSTHLRMNLHLQLGLTLEHTEQYPEGILDDYVAAIAAKITADGGWNQIEYSIAIPGIVEIVPGGHDDYIEWDWSSRGPVTRVHSLPNTFFPKGLLAQHPATIAPLSNPCPWFSTSHGQSIGFVVSGNIGEYDASNLGWLSRFAQVQIVNEALLVEGASASFREVRINALVATKDMVEAGEMVEMHFCTMPVVAGSNVISFTGWVITHAKPSPLQLIRFTLTGNLSPSGFAPALNVAEDAIVVADWVGRSGQIGQKGIAWFDGTTNWVIDLFSSGSASFPFALTEDAPWSTFNVFQDVAAVKLNPDGSPGDSFTVRILGQSRAKSGSRGVAHLESGIYWVSEIQQPALHVRGELTGRLDKYASTIDIDTLSVLSPFPVDIPPPTTSEEGHRINVDNPKNLLAFNGAIVDLGYKASTDRYFIDSVERQAFRVKGIIKEDFLSSDATAVLLSLEGIDGKVAPEFITEDGLTVQNIHEWSGSQDGKAKAEFNWDLGQWELYQVDCDEDQGAPE